MGGREPYLYREGLLVRHRNKYLLHRVSEHKWSAWVPSATEVPGLYSTMRHAIKSIGVDKRGSDSQNVKQALQQVLEERQDNRRHEREPLGQEDKEQNGKEAHRDAHCTAENQEAPQE